MKTILKITLLYVISQFSLLGKEIRVTSLTELNEVISETGKTIKLEPGEYDINQLPSKSRALVFSGSNNTIDLRNVHINATVGEVASSYIIINGNNNTLIGGTFEDTYKSGLKTVQDFSAYNKDRKNLASGLRGAAVMNVDGNENTIQGTKLTVRGSFPYGYGSFYGIGAPNTFGLNKRCGILIRGIGNTLDSVEVQQRAFGHGIYMQDKADKTLIKNTLVEGRLRKTAELYNESDPEDLPVRSEYCFPNRGNFKLSKGKSPIPKNKVHSLCEDGIRMYKIPGSITVENCTVKKMRGGIRLYLGGPAVIKNSKAIDCEYTNFNLPTGGQVIECSGNFNFGPISDYRLKRSRTKAEWTILPSNHAIGDHDILTIQGNDHQITLNQPKGSLVKNEKRAIVIWGNNSTITNNTEYAIRLADGASGNTIKSLGPVSGNDQENTITSH